MGLLTVGPECHRVTYELTLRPGDDCRGGGSIDGVPKELLERVARVGNLVLRLADGRETRIDITGLREAWAEVSVAASLSPSE
ncbi:hypothetical protein N177_0396 [Lutibaculum baratangense AMV1]|uniref:Uncharacterized protein n=1 Tax=Lutibaculum baratangense AMV1 TaxID=631454 RepID=V4RVA4_9HYPH|nr:hypothetical protein N177_0396 [Lutibaculum baratangense AMV1]